MRAYLSYLRWAPIACVLMAHPANAQSANGQIDGSASAEVAEPIRVQHVEDLRFGAFFSPITASTLEIGSDGSVTPTGDVANTINIPQPPEGRGPAQFRIDQDGSRAFVVLYSRQTNITNGTATMRVRRMRGQLIRTVTAGRDSIYRFFIGGRLNIDANQAPGSYSGDIDITVIYL